MDPSPVQAPPLLHDVAVKTEERVRPIPALQTTQVLPQPQRGGPRYKDKFQTLRERYESVTATHTEYSRAVQRATEKEQRLQAEINMLLDAALASAPQTQSTSTPASGPQSTTTPTPVHAQPSPLPVDPQAPPLLLPPAPGHSRAHSQPQGDAGNGPAAPHAHTNGHASSFVASHGHPHAHAHGHGHAHAYPANHGPSTRTLGSSAHGIPNEGGGTT